MTPAGYKYGDQFNRWEVEEAHRGRDKDRDRDRDRDRGKEEKRRKRAELVSQVWKCTSLSGRVCNMHSTGDCFDAALVGRNAMEFYEFVTTLSSFSCRGTDPDLRHSW